MKATVRELRYHLKSVMEAVDRGEDVVITKRGKPKAKMVCLGSAGGRVCEENPFVGMWRSRRDMKDVESYVRKIRRGRFR
jgi:prevent-host-death family protein